MLCESAVAPEPEVAVTITALVPAGVPELPLDPPPLLLEEGPLPPQPAAIPATPARSSRQMRLDTRFPLLKKKRAQAAVSPPPAKGQSRKLLVGAVVAMVRLVVAAAVPLSVSLAGENEQVASLGSPEQEKETAWLKPFVGVTLRVVEPLWPGVTESVVGLALTVKLAGAAGTATLSETAEEVLPL